MNDFLHDLLVRAEVLDLMRCSKWKLAQLIAAKQFPEPIRYQQANGQPGRVCYWSKRAVVTLIEERARKQMAEFVPQLVHTRVNDPFGRHESLTEGVNHHAD